jgi:hypothetical protein
MLQGFLLCSLVLWLWGCDIPRNTETNTTKFSVTIGSINENNVLVSDVLINGAMLDDYVEVLFYSTLENVGGFTFFDPFIVGAESSYDFIVLSTYTVTYQRSDGGQVPAPFTSRCTITLKPPTPSFDATIAPEVVETTAQIAVVLAFLKNQAPLKALHDRGQIYASAEITFYGQDGYGNDVKVRGYLPISFGNFTD